MNTLLFGAPGAGKGTQSALLVENQGMVHISTGDLFRNAIKNETVLGKEAKKYMDQGELVPDAIVIGMVEDALMKLGGKSFILDGFPRTVTQAMALENLLQSHDCEIGKVISLEVPQDELLGRLSGRRVCKGCGAVYHVVGKPPKKEGVCDVCAGEVVQRDDDKEEAIQTRLEVYEKTTSPLKSYYKDQGKLVEVDGTGSAEDVYSNVEAAVQE